MVAIFYNKVAPYLAVFFLLTTIVFMSITVWRGEVILGLQSEVLSNKNQEVKVIIEQHEAANKVSKDYEDRKVDREKEKIYVTRQVEKIVSVPSYANECFDPIGLQYFNSQVSSINSSGKLNNTLSTNTGDE